MLVRRHHGDKERFTQAISLLFIPSRDFIQNGTLISREKNILSIENKKRENYPFSIRRQKLLRTSIIVEMIASTEAKKLRLSKLKLRNLSRN